MAKMTTKLRNAIASLSTGGVGTYYPSTHMFFTRLECVLRDEGFEYEDLAYPTIHTDEGCGRIPVCMIGMDTPLFNIAFTWYRMPSGNWEIICYPTY